MTGVLEFYSKSMTIPWAILLCFNYYLEADNLLQSKPPFQFGEQPTENTDIL